jgi:hypothetical protein
MISVPRADRSAPAGRVTAVTDDSTAAVTDDNDWRVTVRLHESGHTGEAIAHLSTHKVEREVHNRLGGRAMVGTDGVDELYVYAHTKDAAAAASQTVTEVLGSHGLSADFDIERWHPIEEEWESADVELPSTAAEIEAERARLDAEETGQSLAEGHALFEVRVQLPSHRDSVALATRLLAEGYPVVRRWRFLVVGANNRDQAEDFAAKIRPEVPAGAVISIEEVGPLLPFTFLDAAAGSGL